MTRPKPAEEQPEPTPDATPAAAAASASETVEATDTTRRYEPYPGAEFFHGGRYSPIIAAAGARLTQEGHAPAGKTLGPDWTTAHRDAWASYQKTLRPKDGGDTSGTPDETAWDRLRIPRVSPLPKES
ncbi:hypothetical protein [Streptomyces sp. NPDC004783]|uniref:hypothetical protein n=1 Tax=Streptomyces sp. NPDC004783 TaxID=3154459 RepID=UPI0033A1F24B